MNDAKTSMPCERIHSVSSCEREMYIICLLHETFDIKSVLLFTENTMMQSYMTTI